MKRESVLRVVNNRNHCSWFHFRKRADKACQVSLENHSQAGKGCIEKKNARPRYQGPSEGSSTQFATRKAIDAAIPKPSQRTVFEHVIHPLTTVLPTHQRWGGKRNIATNAEMRPKPQVLEHHAYLAAVIDWFSQKVLAWRLSIAMDVGFCIEAVEEAMARYGKPGIFNTD